MSGEACDKEQLLLICIAVAIFVVAIAIGIVVAIVIARLHVLVNVVAIARVLRPVEGDRLAWVLVRRGRGGKLAKAFRQALIRR